MICIFQFFWKVRHWKRWSRRVWVPCPRTHAENGPRYVSLTQRPGFIISTVGSHSVHESGLNTVLVCLKNVCLCHPIGSECDDEEVEFEESDSDESWTTESAISSQSILSSMCMNGGDEKPFACPVPGCKKRYKVRLISLDVICSQQ